MKKAKKKYREMIESVQPFEQRTRYISNIILASILGGIYLSLDEKPDIEKMTVFTRESLMNNCIMLKVIVSEKNYTAEGQEKLRLAAEQSLSDSNPYSWQFTFEAGKSLMEYTATFKTCGMDTRFYRVDNGKIRWYNIDLPVTIDVRRQFLEENGRIKMLAKSAMDSSWADEIEKTSSSALVVIEGLSMYLSEDDIKTILSIIEKNFSKAIVLVEIMSPIVVKRIKEKSIDASNAKFTWGIKSGKELEANNSGFKFVRDVSLTEGMKEIYPIYKLLNKIKPFRDFSNKITVLKTVR